MVVAGVDILVKEQIEFAERLDSKKICLGAGGTKGGKVELMVMEGCWHGWLECKCCSNSWVPKAG